MPFQPPPELYARRRQRDRRDGFTSVTHGTDGCGADDIGLCQECEDDLLVCMADYLATQRGPALGESKHQWYEAIRGPVCWGWVDAMNYRIDPTGYAQPIIEAARLRSTIGQAVEPCAS